MRPLQIWDLMDPAEFCEITILEGTEEIELDNAEEGVA